MTPSDTSGIIVIDVCWYQDAPDNNNRKTMEYGAIWDDPDNLRMIRAELQIFEQFND